MGEHLVWLAALESLIGWDLCVTQSLPPRIRTFLKSTAETPRK